MHSEYGSEVLGREHLVRGVGAHDNRRLHEEADPVVGASTDQHRHGRVSAQACEQGRQPVEGPPVDHCPAEKAQVGHITVGQRRGLRDQPLTQARPPQRGGQVGAGRRRALLPLVLEGAPDQRDNERVRIGAGVGHDEVLAAGLADQSRVVTVAVDPLGDRPPHRTEGGRRSGEVHPGELPVPQRHRRDRRAVPGDHIDHSCRKTRRHQQRHGVVSGELLGRARLPDHRVTHDRRSGRQVRRDRGEVERCHREDEPLQGTVVHAVPRPGGRGRLPGDDLAGGGDVETPEVDQLTGRVDLRLVAALALPEHGRGVESVPPLPRKELGCPQKHRGPVFLGQRPPAGACRQRRVHRVGDVAGCRRPSRAQHQRVPVRGHDLERLAGTGPSLPRDHQG